jgi:exopolysaccharide production protein ExoY
VRFAAVIVLAVVLLLVMTPVFGGSTSARISQVPDAAAYVLAPTGFAAIMIIRQSRRRRAFDRIRETGGIGYHLAKRGIDILLASTALLVTAPFFAVISFLVWRDKSGPILFKRYVIGKNGSEFPMYKFRSMVVDAEKILRSDEKLAEEYYNGNCKLKVDPRVTELGKFLRKTSLDELPQLINILLGQMTFVGPRPIASDEVELYGPALERFKTVTPGITGIWQTSGRSETSYTKRVALDMLYIDNRSIVLDLWLIVMTLPAVLLKRGAF